MLALRLRLERRLAHAVSSTILEGSVAAGSGLCKGTVIPHRPSPQPATGLGKARLQVPITPADNQWYLYL